MSERIIGSYDDALYKLTYTLLYLYSHSASYSAAVLWLGRQPWVAAHRTCVTNSVVYPPTGSTAQGKQARAPAPTADTAKAVPTEKVVYGFRRHFLAGMVHRVLELM